MGLNRVAPTQNGRFSRTRIVNPCSVRREVRANAPGNLIRETQRRRERGESPGETKLRENLLENF